MIVQSQTNVGLLKTPPRKLTQDWVNRKDCASFHYMSICKIFVHFSPIMNLRGSTATNTINRVRKPTFGVNLRTNCGESDVNLYSLFARVA
jgi:hypothetical protein